MKLFLLLLSTLYLISSTKTICPGYRVYWRGNAVRVFCGGKLINNVHTKVSNPKPQDANKPLVFVRSRRTCYTTKQCQHWRKGSKSPLWQECYCDKHKGHSRGFCKFARDADFVSDLAQEKTYDQSLGYETVDLAIVFGFGGILGAVGSYLFNKKGNYAKF